MATIQLLFHNFVTVNSGLIITTFVVLLLLVLMLIAFFILERNLTKKVSKEVGVLQKELRSIQPRFIDISASTEDFLDLAVEAWRLENKFNKIEQQLPEAAIKPFKHSLEKFRKFFAKHDIDIVDFTGQKFNDGLNIDVLNTEKDPSITEPYIKETFEPSIMVRGILVKKAKVIVVNN